MLQRSSSRSPILVGLASPRHEGSGGLAQQPPDRQARCAVCDAERLENELLSRLLRPDPGAFLGQIRIDQPTDTPALRGSEVLDEIALDLEAFLKSTKCGEPVPDRRTDLLYDVDVRLAPTHIEDGAILAVIKGE